MKKTLFFTLIFFYSSLFAEVPVDCDQYKKLAVDDLPYEITFHYFQNELSLGDPIGDVALIRLVHAMPKNLVWMVRHKDQLLLEQNERINSYKACAEELFSLKKAEMSEENAALEGSPGAKVLKEDDLEIIGRSSLSLPDRERIISVFMENAFVVEGDTPPFDPRKMANMFNRVIQEEAQKGIPPELGDHHQWSKSFLRKHYFKYFPFTMMSKVLLALARGETSRFMMTGLEDNLKRWILEQDENSITLDKMFRTSYQINHGNVYLTLLTIENVLSQNWRNIKRSDLPLTKRLKHFTNTLGEDDRFGNWYHLFGIMLYGYVKNRIHAKIIGTIEGVGSDLLQTEKEHQENMINRKGGKAGALLHSWIRSGKWEKRVTNPEFLDEKYYLIEQQDFSKNLKKKLRKSNSTP